MINENYIDLLKQNLSFWDKISENEQKLIIENTVLLKYSPGKNIYSYREESIGVLIVKSGELRAYMVSKDGKNITLYRLKSGHVCILSASSLFKNITFDVNIDAETESEILLINPLIFSKMTEENIYVENFSLKTLTDKFSNVMWAMEQMLFMNFNQRLAIFLLNELENKNSLEIHLTHEQIAKYVGSVREVVSRILKDFKNKGIIKIDRGNVKIVNKEKLEKVARNN